MVLFIIIAPLVPARLDAIPNWYDCTKETAVWEGFSQIGKLLVHFVRLYLGSVSWGRSEPVWLARVGEI